MRRFVFVLPLAVALAACGDSTGPAGVQPALDSIAPKFGTVGTDVRLYGSSMSSAVPKVYFNAIESPSVQIEAGNVFARAPQGLVAGTFYTIKVVNADGGRSDTLTNAFKAIAPTITRVNGATKPTGLVGMTVMIEGSAFGDSPGASKVYFSSSTGAPIQATIADSTNDWTDAFVVTTVPQGVGASSWIWITTPTGVSDSVEFRLIQNGTFSPSSINWTQTTPLPQPLQALGAVFVAVEDGPTPANYVFALGGADSLGNATSVVYRARLQQTGVLESWTTLTAMPEARAYAATTAATVFTAAFDTLTPAVLYVIGGKNASGTTLNTVQFARVDASGNIGAWQTGTPLPVARHAGSAVVFRGYLYFAGGADASNVAQADVYRARINSDGTLGTWEVASAMPTARSHFALVNFGPYIYAIGGETATTTPTRATTTGTETSLVHLSRINLRTGELNPWTALSTQSKARSKHGAIFAGGALLVTSGVYSGAPGSSENAYASVNSDGTIGSWNGATGSETISAEIGISLYNVGVVTFIDASGAGHVLVLGGANRIIEGKPSNAVIYY